MFFLSIKPAPTIQSLVMPHWRNTLGATVSPLTVCTQIGHFVMAITVAAHRDALPGAFHNDGSANSGRSPARHDRNVRFAVAIG
jgi:hypothetical protein